MKEQILQNMAGFHEADMPKVTEREIRIPGLKGKADVFIGMRRAGKTFLCFQKIRQLLSGGIPKDRILYLNFEDDRLLGFQVADFQTVQDLFYAGNPDNKQQTCYFFFDEIQVVEKWKSFIRRLIDTENAFVFITGSSYKMLSSEIASGLRGRSLTTEVFPLSFREFLKFHHPDRAVPATFGTRNAALLRKGIKEFKETGGFPEVQNLEKRFRIEVLQGYVNSVLLKDIIERHRVSNVLVLKHLVKHIMNAAGNLFSVTKFHNTMKSMGIACTRSHLYEFINYLADAFLFYRVPACSRSERNRTTTPQKIYTVDTGLLQAMTIRNSFDDGWLLENMVYIHLRRSGCRVEYVKTRKGYEIDFLARHPVTGYAGLIQVCQDISDDKTFNWEVRGLKETMDAFGFKTGTIVTWDEEKDLGSGIEMLPVCKWMLTEPD